MTTLTTTIRYMHVFTHIPLFLTTAYAWVHQQWILRLSISSFILNSSISRVLFPTNDSIGLLWSKKLFPFDHETNFGRQQHQSRCLHSPPLWNYVNSEFDKIICTIFSTYRRATIKGYRQGKGQDIRLPLNKQQSPPYFCQKWGFRNASISTPSSKSSFPSLLFLKVVISANILTIHVLVSFFVVF